MEASRYARWTLFLVLAILLHCNSSRTGRGQEEESLRSKSAGLRSTLPHTEWVYIDSMCVDKIRRYVEGKYAFRTSGHSTTTSDRYERAVQFHPEPTYSTHGMMALDSRYVIVFLNDTCGVDSVETNGVDSVVTTEGTR